MRGAMLMGAAVIMLALTAVAGCRDKCRDQPACAEAGECKTSGQSCTVGGSSDCRASQLCTTAGECAAKAIRADAPEVLWCRADSADDCRASQICKRFGQCSLGNDSCVAGSEADCRGAAACPKHGSCTAVRGFCLPAAAPDCRASEDCRLHGLCSFQPRDSDYDACRKRVQPRGTISLPFLARPGPPDHIIVNHRMLGEGDQSDPCEAYCTPAADDDCAQSEDCKAKGLCRLGPADPITRARSCVKAE